MSRIVPAPIIGQSAASGAQVIDGSLNFEGGKNQALKRTPTSVGNRKIWTWSCWLKKQNDNRSTFFSAGTTSSDTGFSEIAIGTQKRLRFSGWNTNWKTGSERLRDYNSFYHFVIAVDYTNSTASNKVRLYKNGVEVTDLNNNNTPSDTDRAINDTVIHYIGGIDGGGGENLSFTDYRMSQVYFIDGQQLGPENFGFTDPLTNTWRPKKVSVTGPNDGRIWTNTATISSGSNAANKPLSNGFDGTTATAFEGDTSGATVTVPVSATIGGGGVRVFAAVTSSNPLVVAIKNGASTVETINTGSSGGKYYASSSYSGAITSLVISRTGRAPEFNAIEINGTMLIDGDRTNFGSNGFYLPFDGNSPIGQDKSGRGNDWTPVNFGGSVELDKATGALPILNTTQGGTQAGVGVRTDTTATSINSGQTWSSGSTVTGGTLNNAGQGFDGSISSSGYAELVATDTSTTANVTFTASIPNVTKVEVFVHSASSSGDTRGTCLDTDGVTHTSATLTSASQSFHTIYEGPPITLANVGWGINQNGQTGTGSDGFRAFRVNGYILKDSTSSGEGLVLALPLVGDTNDVSNQINSGSTTKTVTTSGAVASSGSK